MWDDILCVIACIFSVALLTCNVVMVFNAGGGNPISDMKSPADFLLWSKLLLATFFIYVFAVAFVQLAILFLYHRLFFIVDWFRITCYVLMGLVVAGFVVSPIAQVTICAPIQKLWNPSKYGKCNNSHELCNVVGIYHVVLDFAILLIPQPLIWKLKTTTINKISVSLLMLCGTLASISAVLCLSCYMNLSKFSGPRNLPAQMWLALTYHCIEAPLGIICCSATVSAPAIRSIRSSATGSRISQGS
ncbi:hypothetical protein K458DRAFT_471269, partial [Lentithecium fluviatile CBS 122367]